MDDRSILAADAFYAKALPALMRIVLADDVAPLPWRVKEENGKYSVYSRDDVSITTCRTYASAEALVTVVERKDCNNGADISASQFDVLLVLLCEHVSKTVGDVGHPFTWRANKCVDGSFNLVSKDGGRVIINLPDRDTALKFAARLARPSYRSSLSSQ